MLDVLSTWSQVSANRALSYRWFANLFALELRDEQLALYQGDKAEPLLSILSSIGLDDEVERFRQAVHSWAGVKHMRLELAADFAQMFLLDAKTACIPYASAYLDRGELYGSATQLMRNIMRDNQLEIPADFKEPADHLAVILSVMANWIEKEQAAAQNIEQWGETVRFQHNFVQEMLMSFLPEFTRRSQLIDVSNDFYPAVCALLLAYVEADLGYLRICLEDDSVLMD